MFTEQKRICYYDETMAAFFPVVFLSITTAIFPIYYNKISLKKRHEQWYILNYVVYRIISDKYTNFLFTNKK